jgi:hypothetical protein
MNHTDEYPIEDVLNVKNNLEVMKEVFVQPLYVYERPHTARCTVDGMFSNCHSSSISHRTKRRLSGSHSTEPVLDTVVQVIYPVDSEVPDTVKVVEPIESNLGKKPQHKKRARTRKYKNDKRTEMMRQEVLERINRKRNYLSVANNDLTSEKSKPVSDNCVADAVIQSDPVINIPVKKNKIANELFSDIGVEPSEDEVPARTEVDMTEKADCDVDNEIAEKQDSELQDITIDVEVQSQPKVVHQEAGYPVVAESKETTEMNQTDEYPIVDELEVSNNLEVMNDVFSQPLYIYEKPHTELYAVDGVCSNNHCRSISHLTKHRFSRIYRSHSTSFLLEPLHHRCMLHGPASVPQATYSIANGREHLQYMTVEHHHFCSPKDNSKPWMYLTRMSG